MLLRMTATDKRTKQLCKEHGDIWRVKSYRQSVQALGTAGYFMESMDKSHHRWVGIDDVQEL
ncbi:MAG: hypothetical protein GY799_21135 [Desulfobulbaceae bacterium]|nr:hypothetical protein [Desulfobulbaceae bacterium]